MFEKLKEFWKGAPPPIAHKIDDPILGPLTWSEDDEAWVSSAAHGGIGFEFEISGTPSPHGELLAHAADIVRHRDEFIAAVSECLKAESESTRRAPEYRKEVEELRIERVCLSSPNQPDDGMIYFSGGRDYRVWRCDYISRKPKGLGFDS